MEVESSESYQKNNPPSFNQKLIPVEWNLQSMKGFLVAVGGFLVCLCFGSDFSYPNLNSYLTSYMRLNGYYYNSVNGNRYDKISTENFNGCLTYTSFYYLIGAKMMVQGLAMPAIGELARRLGPRLAVLVGSAIYSGGYILTYFSTEGHFAGAVATLSLHGIAFCFVYATTIRTAQAWFPYERRGLVAAIVVSGYGFGSAIWFPIQTQFINPGNLNSTNETNSCGEGARTKYFIQEEVLKQVPILFVVLGIVYASIGCVASAVMVMPDEKNCPTTNSENRSNCTNLSGDHPKEVLRKRWFYQLWTGFFSISLIVAIIGTQSKVFGNSFIRDDHFFRNVAIFQNLLNGFGRLGWGAAYDKFGFKKCYSVIAVVAGVSMAALPVLPYLGDTGLGRGWYAFWLCILFTFCPGIYVIVAAEVNTAFGALYYQSNFGLMYTHYIIYTLVIIVLTKIFGPTGIFLTAAIFAIIGLAVVLLDEILRVVQKR